MRAAIYSALALGLLVGSSSPSTAAPAKSLSARVAALESEVKLLRDRESIRDAVMEYGRSVDARDWTAHRQLYAETVDVDYSAMAGAPPRMSISRDIWVKQLQRFFACIPATQHITDVLSIAIRGNTASAVTMLHAQHYKPNAFGDPVQRMIGTYEMDFTLGKDGWRITRVKPDVKWNEGNSWIFTECAARASDAAAENKAKP